MTYPTLLLITTLAVTIPPLAQTVFWVILAAIGALYLVPIVVVLAMGLVAIGVAAVGVAFVFLVDWIDGLK